MQKTFIGCDPAFRKNGFALCIDDGEELRFMKFKNYTQFLGWFLHERPDAAVFCVENSNLQSALFTNGMKKEAIPNYANGVGKNQAVSQITYWLAQEAWGALNAIEISPKEKGAKIDVKVPLNMRIFRKETNYQSSITQDEMDAYQIMKIGKKLYDNNRRSIVGSNCSR